jgi:uncharacterized protein YbdZ (MbtH family)
MKNKPEWAQHYMISRHESISLILWYVKFRDSKQIVAGGYGSKAQCVNWLNQHWKERLNQEFEKYFTS